MTYLSELKWKPTRKQIQEISDAIDAEVLKKFLNYLTYKGEWTEPNGIVVKKRKPTFHEIPTGNHIKEYFDSMDDIEDTK